MVLIGLMRLFLGLIRRSKNYIFLSFVLIGKREFFLKCFNCLKCFGRCYRCLLIFLNFFFEVSIILLLELKILKGKKIIG